MGDMRMRNFVVAFLLLVTAQGGFAQQPFVITGHITGPRERLDFPSPSLCPDCKIGAKVIASIQRSGPGGQLTGEPRRRIWKLLPDEGNSLTITIGETTWSTDNGYDPRKGNIGYKDAVLAGLFFYGGVIPYPAAAFRAPVYDKSHPSSVAKVEFKIYDLQSATDAELDIGGVDPTVQPNRRYHLKIHVDNVRDGTSSSVASPAIYTLFIGGLYDDSMKPVSGYYHERVPPPSPQSPQFPNPSYHSWSDEAGILQYINTQIPQDAAINIVGHSFGGDTAAKVAVGCGRHINLLITVDPAVSIEDTHPQPGRVGRRAEAIPPDPSIRYKEIKAHVKQWIDINATGGSALELSNFISGPGQWGVFPKGYADIYISEPFIHADFPRMMTFRLPNGKSPEEMLSTSTH